MILSVGEILVDRIVKEDGVADHVGGAPFNVAVNAYRQGAESYFYGKVGYDDEGTFVIEEGEKYLPYGCLISRTKEKKTTVALVTLSDGERSFRFLREGTADYDLHKEDFLLEGIAVPDILHLGTLMLNTAEGREFSAYVVEQCAEKDIVLSVDANFRDDLFATKEERNEIFLPVLRSADILKLSEDELYDITGVEGMEEGIKSFCPKGYAFVTCGSKGSFAYHRDIGLVHKESEPIVPIDTTGAGDAFFGAVLARMEYCIRKGIEIDEKVLLQVLAEGNEAGKTATQKEGAV